MSRLEPVRRSPSRPGCKLTCAAYFEVTRGVPVPFFLYGTSKTRRTPGPALRIDCRACCVENVAAESFETEERIALYFIPLPTQRERHVVCTACGADRLSNLPLDELAAVGPEQTDYHLFIRVSIIVKTLAVAGFLLFPCPVVSLVLGTMAAALSWRAGGWPPRVALLAVTLNVLLWGGLFARSALIDLGVI